MSLSEMRYSTLASPLILKLLGRQFTWEKSERQSRTNPENSLGEALCGKCPYGESATELT